MKKWVVITGILIVLGVAAVFLSNKQDVPSNGKPVINIVGLYPMTGDAAAYGQTARKVVDKFLADWESKNPDARYKYNVVFEDVQTSPQKAVIAANRYIALKKADVFLSILSSVSQPVNLIAERNGIITLSWALDPSISKGDTNFRITSDITDGFDRLLNKMKKMGVKRVSVVNSLEVAQELLANEVTAQLKSRPDFVLTGAHKFNPTERNFDFLVQKIAHEKPDMIIFEGMPPAVDLFLRSMKKQRIAIPVTGFLFIKLVSDKTLAEGFFDIDSVDPDGDFTETFIREFDGGGSLYSEYAVSMLNILINAFESIPLENGKKPSAKSIAQAILNKTKGLKTPLGVLDIDDGGNIYFPSMFNYVENGKVVQRDE